MNELESECRGRRSPLKNDAVGDENVEGKGVEWREDLLDEEAEEGRVSAESVVELEASA